MRRFLTAICGMLLAVAMPGPVGAEKTVSVNDPAVPGVFDQPATAVNGSTVHAAFIGGNSTAGPFRVYYAAIGGGTNFANLSLTRDTDGFLITLPTAVDNTAPGNDAYVDARHPRIAMRSSTEAVILFQAKPAASADPTYVLYLARLTLESNAVVSQSVRMVTGVSGFNEDVSFGLVTTDNTARVAYAGRSTTSGNFNVYYARIALDTAAVAGSPILLSSVAGSTGARPLPSLKLDSSKRAHIAWAANSSSSTPNGIYYAMVKETDGVESVAIAATEVLGRSKKWGHPNLVYSTASSIIILAADESLSGLAGSIGMVNINPNADDQDGSPVQVSTNTKFLLNPPGEAILPDTFSLFRPEAFIDTLGSIHLTGYGSNGTRSTYYAFKRSNAFPFAQFVSNPVPVGLDSSEFPVSLPGGDYTRAAFAFISGKALVFWSGENTATGNRNLDVTGVPTVRAVDSDESGCMTASGHGSGGWERTPKALLLYLPILFLGIRRALRRSFGA